VAGVAAFFLSSRHAAIIDESPLLFSLSSLWSSERKDKGQEFRRPFFSFFRKNGFFVPFSLQRAKKKEGRSFTLPFSPFHRGGREKSSSLFFPPKAEVHG